MVQDEAVVEPAEIVGALAPTEDTHTSFQILHLSVVSCLPHLLRTVPAYITHHAGYDALIEWALASVIAGDETAAAGLPIPDEIAHNLRVCMPKPAVLSRGGSPTPVMPVHPRGWSRT